MLGTDLKFNPQKRKGKREMERKGTHIHKTHKKSNTLNSCCLRGGVEAIL
jgi:hypothetical protein